MTDLPNFNLEEAQIFKDIATSQHDHPVFMLNLNRYKDEADYPSGRIYKSYMKVLDKLLSEVGAKILWRTSVKGIVVGKQIIHEAIGVWSPSHQAFLNLQSSPSSEENMELRKAAIEHADLHRCSTY